jgi:hypothetical protein
MEGMGMKVKNKNVWKDPVVCYMVEKIKRKTDNQGTKEEFLSTTAISINRYEGYGMEADLFDDSELVAIIPAQPTIFEVHGQYETYEDETGYNNSKCHNTILGYEYPGLEPIGWWDKLNEHIESMEKISNEQNSQSS